jgi:hypothetical protein
MSTDRAWSIAHVRILRLGLGTGLALWFSQVVAWPLSFIAPIFVTVFLGLPIPPLKMKAAVGIVVVFFVTLSAGTLLLPELTYRPAVGIILLILALYWSFYYSAKGGSALVGTFATVGIALSAAIGSVSIDLALGLVPWIVIGAAVGIVFVWVGHALLPDSMASTAPPPPPKKPEPTEPDLVLARWSAFRSLCIVFPVALWFLLSPNSASYLAVMIKVASMGQQTTNEDTRKAAKSLLMSTVIGGAGAIIAWQMLSIMPTLSMYTIAVTLAGLIIGSKVFHEFGLAPNGATWSYAYLTMLVILGPAVMDTSGADAGAKFNDRLIMFILATLYAVIAVNIVDAFRPKRVDAYLASQPKS